MSRTGDYGIKYIENDDSVDIVTDMNGNFEAVSYKLDDLNDKMGDRALAQHKHNLSSNDFTGVLPVSKGGTGASTAAAARTVLGLGTAATRAYTTSVTNGSTSLVTGGAVYNAINNLNINNRTHIVIASYDTKNPLRANADYTCTASNASLILKTAINAVAEGGRIELLDGTYNLQYSEEPIELTTKGITIEGSGHTTIINQPVDENAGEAKSIFIIKGHDVKLKNMTLSDVDVSSPVSVIQQQAQGAIYDSVFFIFYAVGMTGSDCCIYGSGDCKYTRIQNCRVFKGHDISGKIMFSFNHCDSFSGVICGNISTGYNDISVKFASEEHKNNTAIYGHTNIDLRIEP